MRIFLSLSISFIVLSSLPTLAATSGVKSCSSLFGDSSSKKTAKKIQKATDEKPAEKPTEKPIEKKFGYVDSEPLGKQIYVKELNDLKDIFTEIRYMDWHEQLNFLVAKDVRNNFMRLRVLSETYEKHDGDFFSPKVETFHELESLLGRVALYQELEVKATSIQAFHLVANFAALENLNSIKLFHKLTALDILDHPANATKKIQTEISEYNKWLSPKEDRQYYIKDMIRFLKKLSKKVDNKEFDQDDLALGLHALRKAIREYTLRITNLDHMLNIYDELDTLPPKIEFWYEELERNNPNIRTNKYFPVSFSELKFGVKIPRKMNSILVEIDGLMGAEKDKDEPPVYLKEAVIDDKDLTRQQKESLIKKIKLLYANNIDQEKIADYYQTHLTKTKLFKTTIEYLKTYNKKPSTRPPMPDTDVGTFNMAPGHASDGAYGSSSGSGY